MGQVTAAPWCPTPYIGSHLACMWQRMGQKPLKGQGIGQLEIFFPCIYLPASWANARHICAHSNCFRKSYPTGEFTVVSHDPIPTAGHQEGFAGVFFPLSRSTSTQIGKGWLRIGFVVSVLNVFFFLSREEIIRFKHLGWGISVEPEGVCTQKRGTLLVLFIFAVFASQGLQGRTQPCQGG